MSADREVLWTVEAYDLAGKIVKTYVFRTREAARAFVHVKSNSKRREYGGPFRAQWGPEQ